LSRVVDRGLMDTERTLFSPATVVSRRLDRLSMILERIEEKVFTEQTLSEFDTVGLVRLYELYHRVSTDLYKYLALVHNLVADESKFQRLLSMLEDTKKKATEVEERLSSPRLRKVLYLVRKELRRKSSSGG